MTRLAMQESHARQGTQQLSGARGGEGQEITPDHWSVEWDSWEQCRDHYGNSVRLTMGTV